MFSHLLFLASAVSSVFLGPSTALASSPLDLDSGSLHQQFGLDLNTTSLQDLASPALTYTPDCSIAYGRNVNHVSCANALSKISQVTTPMTFGERGTGSWDVILPRRYLSDDGQCAIDVKVSPRGAQRDVSNYLQMTNAASALLNTCIAPRPPNSGGVVKQLGVKYRSLSVEMSRSYSIADCKSDLTSARPSYDSCKQVIDTIPWSTNAVNFGLPWQPGTQVPLPYFAISADRQCKLLLGNQLQTAPPVEQASWASIWAGAVAVNEMCVKEGETGYVKPQSYHGTLTLFLFGQGRDPPPEMLASLNISTSDLSMLSSVNATLAATNA